MSVSVGVAVGASVGSALAGVLIALAVAVFFMYRKEKRKIEEEEEIEKKQEEESWWRRAGQYIAQNPNHVLIAIDDLARMALPCGVHPGERRFKLVEIIPRQIEVWVRCFVLPCNPISNSQFTEMLSQCPAAELERLAGQSEDWQQQIEQQTNARATICAFVGRVLAAKMDQNCDMETTLLPPAIMQMYKHVSAHKEPRRFRYALSGFKHIWRTLTVSWYSDVCPNSMLLEHLFDDGDPRLPNVIALEELLIQTLAHFNCCKEGLIRSEDSRTSLRYLLASASELALMVFQAAEPTEFYWPENYPEPGNRRIVYFPGIKEANCIPGSYQDKADGMEMEIQHLPARWRHPLNQEEWANTDENTERDLFNEEQRMIDKSISAKQPYGTTEEKDRFRAMHLMPPLSERLNYPSNMI